MKQFLTSLLGTLVGLFLFTVFGFLLCAGIVGAIVSATMHRTESVKVEPGSYLVMDLSASITDAPPEFDLALGGDHSERLQLRQVLRAIQHAEHDRNIAGILLMGSFNPTGTSAGYGALREIRAALIHFQTASRKPVKAYLEFATTRDYYVASVAKEIDLDPYGVIYMPGLASEPMFFAGLFQKYGIGIQVTRVGKYKSFVEPFTRENMSPENREETQRLLDDLWGSILADIGQSRRIAPAQIQRVVDRDGLIQAGAARRARLVNRTLYRDQVIDELRKETGEKEGSHTFRQVSLAAYARELPAAGASHARIAVVYAEGDIVDGEGDYDQIGGVRFARKLRELRQDDNVKAIVLRVDSPGGSATAAEDILREVVLCRKAKPVIVSMGSYAASGGYWISTYGDRIFAEPTTITGSIGVFGIQFDVQRLANDHGVTFDVAKTGKFADSLTLARPKTPEELAVLQRMIDWIYSQFVAKVADGRRLPTEKVEEIAQGRVWSGAEAKKLGLVDEIGSLPDAIRYAVAKAGLEGKSYRVDEFPQKRDLSEAVAELLGRVLPETDNAKGSVPGRIEAEVRTQLAQLKAFNDPAGIYARLPLDLSLR
jgi:protease-4